MKRTSNTSHKTSLSVEKNFFMSANNESPFWRQTCKERDNVDNKTSLESGSVWCLRWLCCLAPISNSIASGKKREKKHCRGRWITGGGKGKTEKEKAKAGRRRAKVAQV